MSTSLSGPGPPEPGGRLDDTVRSGLRIGAAAVVVVVAALVGVGVRASLTHVPQPEASLAQDQMVTVSPGGVLAPEDVPERLRSHYQAATDHYEIFEEVPCFCGCEAMLGHRHLGDCFLRSDGEGLEAHAVGCGVCLGEAQQVDELIAAGVGDSDLIRAAVIADWGDPYQNQ